MNIEPQKNVVSSRASDYRKKQFDRDMRELLAHITICAEAYLKYGEQMSAHKETDAGDIVSRAVRLGYAGGWNRLNCHHQGSAKSAAHALLEGVNCHEEAARLSGQYSPPIDHGFRKDDVTGISS